MHISRARCTHPRTHSRTRACVRAYIPSHRPRHARVAHPFTRSHVAPLYTIASHRVYTRTHATEDLSPFRTDTVKRLNGPLCARSRVPSWGSRCSKDSIGFNHRFDLDSTSGEPSFYFILEISYKAPLPLISCCKDSRIFQNYYDHYEKFVSKFVSCSRLFQKYSPNVRIYP